MIASWLRIFGLAGSAMVLLGYLIFVYLPVGVLILYSFQDGSVPLPPFRGFSTRWYAEIFSDNRLMAAIWRSGLLAVSSAFLATVLAFGAAYAAVKSTGVTKAVLNWLMITPLTVSYLVLGLGLLLTLQWVGLSRSIWSLLMGHVVISIPISFLIISSQLGRYLETFERAAADLGASPLKTLVFVVAPISAPSLVASFFISLTTSWDEFVMAFLLTRFDTTLPVEIWAMLRRGLQPTTNAVGTLVFAVSLGTIPILEVCWTLWNRQNKSAEMDR